MSLLISYEKKPAKKHAKHDPAQHREANADAAAIIAAKVASGELAPESLDAQWARMIEQHDREESQ